MSNFALNIYKAFGIRKTPKPSYSVRLHDFVYDKDDNPIEDGLLTHEFAPLYNPTLEQTVSPGEVTHQVSNARKAMFHAINHVRNTNSPANIYTPTGGDALLYAHPKTGVLTLRHVAHSDDENALSVAFRDRDKNKMYRKQGLTNRDTAAFNRLKHLHKNSLITLGAPPMDIDTKDLNALPAELHTTDEAREFNKPL